MSDTSKTFLNENFLLESSYARELYHEYAKDLPIIDYHNHLPPDQIADDRVFDNLTQIWLDGDHYKWRAMRAHGVDEKYISGDAPEREKFLKWAETVPYTVRNPLYHWTHMELANPFGVKKLLGPDTAGEIYEQTADRLRSEYSVVNLLEHFKVEVLCTTDDPVDTLEHHARIRERHKGLKVYPAFRPDKVMAVEDRRFNAYLDALAGASGVEISTYDHLLQALRRRHDFFAENGCSISDHGLEQIYAQDYAEREVASIFERLRSGRPVSGDDALKYKSAVLYELAVMDHEKDWVQQYHLGPIRNNNSRLLQIAGADAGCDSVGDFPQASALSRFLDRLDRTNQLAKTILYNINPAQNEVFATMAGNFNDGSVPGKVQWGSAWWFLDQKDGIEKQLNALSNLGLISHFVGMLTDSRSFLSFSRHEYFRRVLCNLFGRDIEKGELPDDTEWVGKLVKDICYFNARRYFGFDS